MEKKRLRQKHFYTAKFTFTDCINLSVPSSYNHFSDIKLINLPYIYLVFYKTKSQFDFDIFQNQKSLTLL